MMTLLLSVCVHIITCLACLSYPTPGLLPCTAPQELDDAKAANKALKEENQLLTADKAHLQQQCDSRSTHCMTLIADNKRLMDQVGTPRGPECSLATAWGLGAWPGCWVVSRTWFVVDSHEH